MIIWIEILQLLLYNFVVCYFTSYSKEKPVIRPLHCLPSPPQDLSDMQGHTLFGIVGGLSIFATGGGRY